MARHISHFREGFPLGVTEVTSLGEREDETGIGFAILRLGPGDEYTLTSEREMALLLMSGAVTFEIEQQEKSWKRTSLFDQSPLCLHISCDVSVSMRAENDVEWTLFEVENYRKFPSVIYENVANEHRGKGLVDDASYRFVRTIFDGSNSHSNTELVLGEVVNFPGRWSSYPPHHHPQPEIYHYRFTEPQGYGHAELGEQVFKVKQFDTLKILDELDHAQCSAPGYGMYYLWVIRHLPGNRYTVPDFTEEHRWTMEEGARGWEPPIKSAE